MMMLWAPNGAETVVGMLDMFPWGKCAARTPPEKENAEDNEAGSLAWTMIYDRRREGAGLIVL
jgi:hypothetical protein